MKRSTIETAESALKTTPKKAKKSCLSISPHSPMQRQTPGSTASTIRTAQNVHQAQFDKLWTVQKTDTAYNDPIHKMISFCPIVQALIDTTTFARLSTLKQLGTCYYVYRGAMHTRFEHSLGVAHLANVLVSKMRNDQPELCITDSDVICVTIAGLCHDLGHGPFSHVYDGVFLQRIYPKGCPIDEKGEYCADATGKNGKSHRHVRHRHEDGSVRMLRHLLKKNNITCIPPQDLQFIEEIIGGVNERDRKGRDESKFYLYDIVNNCRSGLDVDKLDYFVRDCKTTGAGNDPTIAYIDRFLTMGKVMLAEPILSSSSTGNDAAMLCYPEKLAPEAIALFALRFNLHQVVYTHKTVKKIEYMICDLLEMSEPYIFFVGNKTPHFPDGRYRISQCIYDPVAFERLNDSVVEIIRYQSQHIPELTQAVKLLERIEKRQLYPQMGRIVYQRGDIIDTKSVGKITEEIVGVWKKIVAEESEGGVGQREGNGDAYENVIVDTSVDVAVRSMNTEEDFVVLSQDSVQPPTQSDLKRRAKDKAIDRAAIHKRSLSNYSKSTSTSSNFSQSSSVSSSSSNSCNMTSVVLTVEDLIVEKMHIHYGQKKDNPVDNMRFFQKGSSRGEALSEKDRRNLKTRIPSEFEYLAIRCFCRNDSRAISNAATKAFERWCQEVSGRQPSNMLLAVDPLSGDDYDSQEEERNGMYGRDADSEDGGENEDRCKNNGGVEWRNGGVDISNENEEEEEEEDGGIWKTTL